MAQRFIASVISVTTAEHPRIRFETVTVPDLEASSKALEEGRVDIALVRSDVRPPANGQTLVILRRDVITIVLPHGSPIKAVAGLSGKTIAIPAGPAQDHNSQALDAILNFYNVAPSAVKRVFLPMSEIGRAIGERHAVAVLAVGPIGPGEAVDAVSSVAAATKRAPKILEFEEGDAIAKRSPGSRRSMFPRAPSEATRRSPVIRRRASPSLIVLENAECRRNRRLEANQKRIVRLLVIADEAMNAGFSELEAMEREFHAIVASCVNKLADGSSAADQAPVSLAIAHARRSIEARMGALSGKAVYAIGERAAVTPFGASARS